MATKEGVAKVGKMTKTKTIGTKKYTKTACALTKAEAKKKAKNLREKGTTARVLKNSDGKGFCLYKGAKKAKAKKK